MSLAGTWSGTDTDFGMMGSFGSWWPIMIVMSAIVILVVVALIFLVLEEPAHAAPYAQSYPGAGYPVRGASRPQASRW
jgi:uncharacterized membrane protein